MNTSIKKIKLEASSVEDAIRRVASELEVPESCLQANIISEGKSFLGLFGKKMQLEITVNPNPVEPSKKVEKESHDVKRKKPANSDNDDKEKSKRKKSVDSDIEDEEKSKQKESADSDVLDEEKLKLMNESKMFIDELIKKMDLNVSPQISGSFISLDGEDAAIVVGRYGDTLKAIEYLLNLCVRETKDVPRIRLDSDGYRERRTANLQHVAISAAKKAAERGIPVRLESMISWERRIIHLTLQDNPDVVTESIGESPDRKVVIMPRVKHDEVRTRPRRRLRR
ncbi:MAG: Jag N-terminal domain-containing protein [Synergistaceae bacterium]|nr:Jag N-terminal domain-containing protein [Synergistaceae bacterium]